MHSSVLIGRKGVPVICQNLAPLELRLAIQPENDREEYMLLMIEELALRVEAAEKLGEDYDDDDDDELIAEKLTLAEKVRSSERQVSNMLERMESNRNQTHEILRTIKSALLVQAMVASQEERLNGLLQSLAVVKDLVGRKWDDLKP